MVYYLLANLLISLFCVVFAVGIDEYMTLASGGLLIGSVRSRDAGHYRCSGYNDVIDARAWSPAVYHLHVVDGMTRLLDDLTVYRARQ